MIIDVLTEDLAEINLKSKNKKDILAELLNIINKSGKINNLKLALKEVQERENLCSTGMENGIAIPHAKTDAVDDLIACVGISKKPVHFDSIDGKPAQIFLMTLSPKGKSGPHIRFLAEIARLLKDNDRRARILKASSNKELLDTLKD